jgi:hypothetical protein
MITYVEELSVSYSLYVARRLKLKDLGAASMKIFFLSR